MESDILSEIKNIFRYTEKFEKSKNFYFENHFCDIKNEIVKVDFEYSIINQKSKDKIVFGNCKHCKKTFYNVDYE